jgi:hypothetical protein
MNFSRCLVISCVLALASVSGAWAQLPGPIQLSNSNQSFSIEGLKFTFACSAACTKEELVPETGVRGSLSFLLVGDQGTATSNTLNYSAALTDTAAASASLQVNFTVTDLSSSKTITGWSVTTVGSNKAVSGDTASGSAAVSSPVGAAPTLTNTFTFNASGSETNPGTGFTSYTTYAPTATNPSLAFNELLSLGATTSTTNTSAFNIYSQLITFRTVPEPITLSLFGVGLVGLGAARRARRSAR